MREAIMSVTQELLAGAPAGGVTARAVTAAAGVSTGTLFHYFGSIDELLLAVAERAAAQQPTRFGDPVHDGVEGVLARLFSVDRRDTVLPWLRQRAIESDALRAGLHRYDTSVNESYRAAIELSRERLNLDDDVDVEAAIEVVRALAEGFQLRLASGTLGVDPERFVHVVAKLVLNGFAKADRP